MSLRDIVKPLMLQKMLGLVREKYNWKILVVDNLAMRIISATCKMEELYAQKITLVEDLGKKREPIPLDAVYFITPTEESVKIMLRDFEDEKKPMYNNAHLFMTSECPSDLVKMIKDHQIMRSKLKTFVEIYVYFLPVESKIFTLDSRNDEVFKACYGGTVNETFRNKQFDKVAEQIATLCVSLGEFPRIRYDSTMPCNKLLANSVLKKLKKWAVDDPTLAENEKSTNSILLILDRGFDGVSPLIHELTFQAMVYDLLQIENDVYKMKDKNSKKEMSVLLDENDEQWLQLRHKHIAEVSKIITGNMKDFTNRRYIHVGTSLVEPRDWLIGIRK